MVTATSKFHRLIFILMTGTPLVFFAPSCSSSDSGSPPGGGSPDASTDSPTSNRPEPKFRLFAGGDNTCAVLADGSLKCWGANNSAQLGSGSSDSSKHPKPGDAIPGIAVKDLAIHNDHMCAVVANEVKCWGKNQYGGQTGQPSSTSEKCGSEQLPSACTKAPTAVATVNGAARVAAGNGFSCAQLPNEIRCWGANSSGILGPGDSRPLYDNPPSAVPISNASDISTFAAGESFGCARKGGDGSIWCWGDARTGQIGRASGAAAGAPTWDTKAHPTPQQVDGLANTRALAVGHAHACAVLSDKTVSCWGSNGNVSSDGWEGGQLGHAQDKDEKCAGDDPCTGVPTPVEGLQNVRELALGDSHSCALLEDDTVTCWGYALYGRLGHDPTLDPDAGTEDVSNPKPIPVQQLSNVAHIVAGEMHTCAVTWDSKVSCWGAAFYGQVDSKGSSHVPVPVKGLE